MSSSPMYDPGSSEARSSWLAGLTEICAKLSGVLNMKTGTFEDLTLPELFISETDRYRIYQAPLGNKLWMQSPAPIIKKNGVVISPESDYFEIDYLGGSIVFEDSHVCTADDVITASASYIIDGSKVINDLAQKLNIFSEKANNFQGSFDTLADLESEVPVGSAGFYAIVQDENTVYLWNETKGKWENVNGSIYQYAVDGGYTGTEAEFQTLMGSGPWLPAKNNTVINNFRIGSNTRSANLILDSYYYDDGPVYLPVSNYDISKKPVYLYASTPKKSVRSLNITGCDKVDFNNSTLSNVAMPVDDSDAATKEYAYGIGLGSEERAKRYTDFTIANTCVKSFTFTILGYFPENGVINLSFSGLPSDPFDGKTIFFGQPTYFPIAGELPSSVIDFKFEVISHEASQDYDEDEELTYGGSITIKSLTEIPDHSEVRLILVYI